MRRQKEKCLLFDCPSDSICRYPSYAPLRTTQKKTDGGANFSNLHNAPLRMVEGKAAETHTHNTVSRIGKSTKHFSGKYSPPPLLFFCPMGFRGEPSNPSFPPLFFVVAAISGGRKFREHWIRGKRRRFCWWSTSWPEGKGENKWKRSRVAIWGGKLLIFLNI